MYLQLSNFCVHCKSGSHKVGIRKSSRKTYNHIMDIYRFEADTVIIKKEIIISFLKINTLLDNYINLFGIV